MTPKFLAQFEILPFRWLMISLNAATAETYLRVNRGLPWSRIRRNLDAVLEARRTGRLLGDITYTMVILRANVHEIVRFADLGLQDRVGVRYILPHRNRNEQSIFLSYEAMAEAAAALELVATRLQSDGQLGWAEEAQVSARILRHRIESGVLEPIGNLG